MISYQIIDFLHIGLSLWSCGSPPSFCLILGHSCLSNLDCFCVYHLYSEYNVSQIDLNLRLHDVDLGLMGVGIVIVVENTPVVVVLLVDDLDLGIDIVLYFELVEGASSFLQVDIDHFHEVQYKDGYNVVIVVVVQDEHSKVSVSNEYILDHFYPYLQQLDNQPFQSFFLGFLKHDYVVVLIVLLYVLDFSEYYDIY